MQRERGDMVGEERGELYVTPLCLHRPAFRVIHFEITGPSLW